MSTYWFNIDFQSMGSRYAELLIKETLEKMEMKDVLKSIKSENAVVRNGLSFRSRF